MPQSPLSDESRQTAPCYNLFSSRKERDLYLAVPETDPLPTGFMSGWKYERKFAVDDVLPAGFESAAAAQSTQKDGYYAFYTTTDKRRS